MYERIRELREAKDLKQKDIAELLHINQGTYSRYESGYLDIPSSVLITLASYYDVSVDDLRGLTNKKKV